MNRKKYKDRGGVFLNEGAPLENTTLLAIEVTPERRLVLVIGGRRFKIPWIRLRSNSRLLLTAACYTQRPPTKEEWEDKTGHLAHLQQPHHMLMSYPYMAIMREKAHKMPRLPEYTTATCKSFDYIPTERERVFAKEALGCDTEPTYEKTAEPDAYLVGMLDLHKKSEKGVQLSLPLDDGNDEILPLPKIEKKEGES